MKKILVVFLCFMIAAVAFGTVCVSAEYSGGGGNFGTPQKESEYEEEPMTEEDASGMIMQLLQLIIFGGTPITAYIIYERKLSKSARASKKIMAMLDQKDSVWKYKNILSRFKEIFSGIKNAKENCDLCLATDYTTQEMLEKLKMQQTWAQTFNKHREPSRIRLLDSRPVAVFDCYDDECDHIWFYVEWSVLENDDSYNSSKSYIKYKEFWQLKRCSDEWLLSDIVDKETGDKLIFGEESNTEN